MTDQPIARPLQGQIALVTGASRGIGQAIADRLLAEGATVVGTATSASGAEAIASRIGHGLVLNVTDAGACESLLADVQSRLGAPSILVNNAGITRDNLAMRMKDDEWADVLATNLSSVFRLSRAVLRPMMKSRHGRIINITSVVASSGNPGQANYAAAKAGVEGMTRALAQEIGSRGITVNCVAPGFIDTDMTRSLSDSQQDALRQRIPLGRLGQPDDIGAAVAFLAGPGAAYITGITLPVNGGMYMA